MSSGNPIVLVPGLNCSARLFAAQIPVLWRFGPVTVADNRRGDSMAGIARHILDEAPPRFALLGLSMGGYIGWEILRQAPDRVLKLAVLDSAAGADRPEQKQRRDEQIALARADRFGEIPDTLFPFLVARHRHGDETLQLVVRQMAEETGAEAFIQQQTAIKNRVDSRPDLPRIACPTLVLCGERDELTPPALSQEMAGQIPSARLVLIPDCGHLSTLEHPEAVNRALAEWMEV